MDLEYKFVIIFRDINGHLKQHSFVDRGAFYTWALKIAEGKETNPEELEILGVYSIAGNSFHVFPLVLYTALGNEPLSWEELVGYLA